MKKRRDIVKVLLAVWVAACLVWSVNLRDPHTLFMREYEAFLLLLLICAGLLFSSIKVKRYGAIPVAGFLLAFTVSVVKEYQFYHARDYALTSQLSEAYRVNRHMIVGVKNFDTARQLAKRGIAGIYLSRHNVAGLTAKELKEKIRQLQISRYEDGLPPLIIATDEEGGVVSRLSGLMPGFPALSTLLEKNKPGYQLLEKTRKLGYEKGKYLADLGITVNFSPVVDLRIHNDNSLDFHSQISKRAISYHPDITSLMANAYIQGLGDAGVTATLKHFPGLGHVEQDTHHFSAVLDKPMHILNQQDLKPFRSLAGQQNSWIMLSHVIFNEVDNENPVSASKKVVDGLLRKDWSYHGILVTDDLSMSAYYNKGLCRQSIKSLNAGVDYLLISYDSEKYFQVYECLSTAIRHNMIDKEMLHASSLRTGSWYSSMITQL